MNNQNLPSLDLDKELSRLQVAVALNTLIVKLLTAVLIITVMSAGVIIAAGVVIEKEQKEKPEGVVSGFIHKN